MRVAGTEVGLVVGGQDDRAPGRLTSPCLCFRMAVTLLAAGLRVGLFLGIFRFGHIVIHLSDFCRPVSLLLIRIRERDP